MVALQRYMPDSPGFLLYRSKLLAVNASVLENVRLTSQPLLLLAVHQIFFLMVILKGQLWQVMKSKVAAIEH